LLGQPRIARGENITVGSTRSAIPLTSFRGTLKQLQCEHLDEKQSYAFDAVFPSFRRLDEYLTLSDWGPVNTGFGSRVVYAGRGRERRYAGDKTLSRGRYFSICHDKDGDDTGTLLNELKAYYSYESKLPCEIFDSTISDGSVSELERFNHKPIEWPHILLRVGPKTPNHVAHHISGTQHYPIIHIPLPLSIESVEIGSVLDLRLRDAQDWFYWNFRRIESELRVSSLYYATAKETLMQMIGFRDMFPILTTPEIGGSHPFLQGVGAWLRSHEVDALIYPSARVDCLSLCSPQSGALEYWDGWNLVFYKDAPPLDWRTHFGHTATWRPFVPPTYKYRVWDEYVGFKCEGVTEWNERRFRRSLALAAADAQPGLSDFMTGLFSILDADPSKM
jgi:hypothetical protein